MLLGARLGMSGGGGSPLPYIEVSGNAGQWVDTGIKSAGDYIRIIATFSPTRFKTSESTEGYQYLFSGDNSSSKRWTSAEIVIGYTQSIISQYGKRVCANIGSYTTKKWSDDVLVVGDIYTLDFEAKTTPSKVLTMGGSYVSSYSFSGNGVSTGNINLFRAMHATSLNCVPHVRLFGLEIYTSENSLSASLVPKNDGAIGYLHDDVRGVDLYSQGGVDFGFGRL